MPSGPSRRAEGHPFRIPLGSPRTIGGVIDTLVLLPFATGAQPYARIGWFRRLPADADITPLGGRLAREEARQSGTTWLVTADGWTMQLNRDTDGSGYAEVVATS